jgi:hypothetical protein
MIVLTAPTCFTRLEKNSNRFEHRPVIFHLTRNYVTNYDKKGVESYKGWRQEQVELSERLATKSTTDLVTCHDDEDVHARDPLHKGQ